MKMLHLYRVKTFLLVVFITAGSVKAQSTMDSVFSLNDTVQTLTLDELYKIILTYHPVVKQAQLLSAMVQQEIRIARGSFDPKLMSNLDHKEFENKTYYSKLDACLSFPTWFPVNPKVGYQRNTGELLNNENGIPGGKQLYAGVSVPLGRGLFTDERRTAVRQAKLFSDIAAADQVKIINKILLEAAKDYWQWYYAYYQLKLSSQAASLAEEIFSRVKINVTQGEAAVVDTIQAKITLQSRRVERQEAMINFQNTAIAISNYLWDAEGNPVQLDIAVAPLMTMYENVILQNDLLEDLVVRARKNHPELVKFSIKLNQLELDQSLARELIKPQLDFSYVLLSQPSAPHQVDPLNDYKVGVDFSFPVFMRKERSKLALTRLKIDNLEFQRSQSEREIVNEVNATFNELKNTRVIIAQQEEVVELYSRLLSSELFNLENGESDLFKINIQQEKLLQSQTKLLKLKTDFQKQKALLYWAAGIKNLNTQIN